MRKRKKLKLQQLQEEPEQQNIQIDDDEVLSGLYLFGEVIDRSKRTIPQTSIEVVTYEIQDNAIRFFYTFVHDNKSMLAKINRSDDCIFRNNSYFCLWFRIIP